MSLGKEKAKLPGRGSEGKNGGQGQYWKLAPTVTNTPECKKKQRHVTHTKGEKEKRERSEFNRKLNEEEGGKFLKSVTFTVT